MVLTKRIIPCLDVANGRVVKGLNFESIKDAGDPVQLAEKYSSEGVELRGCKATQEIIEVKTANEEDWRTEYLAPILSINVVEGIEKAIEHINKYGSRHRDGIVTHDESTAEYFLAAVDSSGAYVNCSTRFADGFRYGFGAEVGISTQTLPPRGPVGLDQLVSYKYEVLGTGQIRK